MPPDNLFIEQCLALDEGEVASSELMFFNVHRYDDGWWVLWHEPPSINRLGVILRTKEELMKFLTGKPAKADHITAPRMDVPFNGKRMVP